jgi:hypothetical protein
MTISSDVQMTPIDCRCRPSESMPVWLMDEAESDEEKQRQDRAYLALWLAVFDLTTPAPVRLRAMSREVHGLGR